MPKMMLRKINRQTSSHILTHNDQPPKYIYCLTFYIQFQGLKMFRAEFFTLLKLLIEFMSFNYYVTSVGLQFEMVQGRLLLAQLVKNPPAPGEPGSISGSRRFTGEGRGYHSSIVGLPSWFSW